MVHAARRDITILRARTLGRTLFVQGARTSRMPRIKALCWWIIALLMLGGVVNFLARNSLAIAKPTLSAELGLTDQQYALILTCFQLGLILQPICGYLLEWLGLRVGFALFAIAWSVVNMAHGLVGGWIGLATLRALMGFAEGSANPAVMKTISAWFPARERGMASGVYNVGASLGSVMAPPLVAWAIYAYHWQAAFVVTGGIGIAWAVVWLALYNDPDRHAWLSQGERSYVLAGKEGHLQSSSVPPSIFRLLRQRNFLGHWPTTHARGSDLGNVVFLGAIVFRGRASFRSRAARDLHLDAVSCGGRRQPLGWPDRVGGAASYALVAGQRAAHCVHGGRAADATSRIRRQRQKPLSGGRAAATRWFRAPNPVGDRDHDVDRLVPPERSLDRHRNGRHLRQFRDDGLHAAARKNCYRPMATNPFSSHCHCSTCSARDCSGRSCANPTPRPLPNSVTSYEHAGRHMMPNGTEQFFLVSGRGAQCPSHSSLSVTLRGHRAPRNAVRSRTPATGTRLLQQPQHARVIAPNRDGSANGQSMAFGDPARDAFAGRKLNTVLPEPNRGS